jgi:transcriptional regulator with XRE-family HTH domain
MQANKNIAWNVRKLRVALGISQDELALRAGIDRAYCGYLERGMRNPTVSMLSKIAGALEVHISELFIEPPDGSAPMPPLRSGRRKTKH